MSDWYVDGVLGTDDVSHGTGEGADAFKTLQYAVDFAAVTAGDTIHVAAATYTEDADVDEAGITIKAASLAAIVDGGFRLNVGTITTDGFTIKNGRAGPVADYPACVAADKDGTSGHKIINNVTVGAGADLPKTGIYTKNVTDVYIESNEVKGGSRGIVFLSHCDRTIVVHNDIHDNVGYGIGPGEFSPDCILRCNDIYDNLDGGIQAYKSTKLKVNLNNIHGNTPRGVSYYDQTDLDVHYNWWGAADGPGGDFGGSGDELGCDHGTPIAYTPIPLIAPVAHTKDSVRNTLVGLGKLAAAGGVFNFMAPSDAYDSGLVAATRAKLEAATGRIGESFKGVDEDGVAITLMAVGNPDTGRYRAILRTPTETYKVDVAA